MDAISQFSALGPTLAGVVGGIDAADLDLPTPCAEFGVRGVLEHMLTGATTFTAAFRGEEPGNADLTDPLAAFGPTLGALGDAVSAPGALDGTVASPFGPMPGEQFARFIVLDGLVHGWDLAQATGQPYEPPDELVTSVADFAHQVLDPIRGEGSFGPAQPAPAGASPIDALAAYTGRAVHTPGAATPNRALWEKGDFTRLAESMRDSGDALVDRIGIHAGMTVLDLGCGDGTTAIPAAERGGDVLGVDVATNLVAAGRRRAAERGLATIRFEHGDARDLSWIPDDSFDATVSVFGAMFAPEPAKVAAEMVRVTRPGGRIVMGNWIPGDPTLVAQILKISCGLLTAAAGGLRQPDDVGRARAGRRALHRGRRACGERHVRARHLRVRDRGVADRVARSVPRLLRTDHERVRGRRRRGPGRRALRRARRTLPRPEPERGPHHDAHPRHVPARHRRRVTRTVP